MNKEKMTKSEWLKVNGFSEDGVTFVVVGNSYKIKDALKDAGFKFSPLLRWHTYTNEFPLTDDCSYVKFNYNDIFVWNEEEGITFLKENTRDILDNTFNPPRESKSEHQGVIGDKIENVLCELVHIGGYSSAYGYKWIYTFRDERDNEYVWFTTIQQAIGTGMGCYLTGTVKEHSEYKGVKTTVLTRCKIIRTMT